MCNSGINRLVVFTFLVLTVTVSAQDTLTLMEAVTVALDKNYSVIVSRNEALIAGNNNSAGNAGMLPEVVLDFSQNTNVSNTHQKRWTGDIIDKPAARAGTFSSRITMNWTVFDGFAMFITRDKLEELEKLGETEAAATVQNTVNEVIIGYYEIVLQNKMMESLQQMLKISGERVELAKNRRELGSGSELEVYQALVDRNTDSSRVVMQRLLIREAMISLNRLLTFPETYEFRVSREIPLKTDLEYDELMKDVLASNPDLDAARKNLRLAGLNVKLAKSARYPQIGVFAGYNFTNSTSQSGFYELNRAYGPTYGLTATMNIFNGLNTNRDIRNSNTGYLSQEVICKQTEMEVRSDLYRLYHEYLSQLTLVGLEEQNVRTAAVNTGIAYEKYKLGGMSEIDFRVTQQKQLDAESRLLNARFQSKIRETQLLNLSGKILGNIE